MTQRVNVLNKRKACFVIVIVGQLKKDSDQEALLVLFFFFTEMGLS